MKRLIVAAMAFLALCAVARADLSAYTGWYDPSTGITWEGTSHMSAEDPLNPGMYLAADVDWVVEWDSGAGQFHYIYQVTTLGDYAVSLLSVPMLPSNEAENLGWQQLAAGEVSPQGTSGFVPLPPAEATQAKWDFAGLAPGQTSYMLDYWSVNKPLSLGGFVQDGGLFAADGALPSPDNEIPEPATLSLVALGAVALVRRRK